MRCKRSVNLSHLQSPRVDSERRCRNRNWGLALKILQRARTRGGPDNERAEIIRLFRLGRRLVERVQRSYATIAVRDSETLNMYPRTVIGPCVTKPLATALFWAGLCFWIRRCVTIHFGNLWVGSIRGLSCITGRGFWSSPSSDPGTGRSRGNSIVSNQSHSAWSAASARRGISTGSFKFSDSRPRAN
jgi:hypothetical protein